MQIRYTTSVINGTTKLVALIDSAICGGADVEQMRQILASARSKLILLSAAQDAARNGEGVELLREILDEGAEQ